MDDKTVTKKTPCQSILETLQVANDLKNGIDALCSLQQKLKELPSSFLNVAVRGLEVDEMFLGFIKSKYEKALREIKDNGLYGRSPQNQEHVTKELDTWKVIFDQACYLLDRKDVVSFANQTEKDAKDEKEKPRPKRNMPAPSAPGL